MDSPMASKPPKENNVDIVDMKKELVESIKTYGYTPLTSQKRAIELFSKGKNVIMQGVSNRETSDGLQGTYIRGRIATYGLAVLNQSHISRSVKCKCLIITSDSDYINEVILDMQSLGGPKVKVGRVDDHWKKKTHVHVAVGGIPDMRVLFSDDKFCLPYVEMLVFDWGCTYLSFNQTIYCTQWVYKMLKERKSVPKDYQFAVFSDNKVPDGFSACPNKLEIELVDFYADCKYTFDGIEKHKFISVKEDMFSSYEALLKSKVAATLEVLNDVKPSENNHIIIIISGYGQFDYVKGELSDYYEVDTLHEGMTMKDRDLVVKKFFDGKSLLVTRKEWLRDLHPDYLGSRLGAVIYFNCREDNYHRSLGWFGNVGTAVTVVNPTELFDLLGIQEAHKAAVFERIKPSKFTRAEGLPKFNGQKHYLFYVGGTDNNRKREVEGVDDILVAYGVDVSQTSVILVKDPELVDILISDLKERFTGVEGLVITSEFSEASETMNKVGHTCILVTADSSLKVGEIKNDVYVLVIYDMLVEKDDYYHICGWCNDKGVVVHMATRLECFEIFDIQVNLGVSLVQFRVGRPENYLEETFPDVYRSSKDDSEDDSDDDVVEQTLPEDVAEQGVKRKTPPT